jgi:hypothetical protein
MNNPIQPTDPGRNRTGIATSPAHTKELIAGTKEAILSPRFDMEELTSLRVEFSHVAPPVGTMPPPATLTGAAKAAVKVISGKHPMVFLDLLGERLAFERTGTRLYDALLVKVGTADEHDGGPSAKEVALIRDDELKHFLLLKETLESLGGDSTAITPSGDIAAVASKGLIEVLTDPRSTLSECLKTILIAELADNDSWAVLADLAERLGHDEWAERFRDALITEEEHLTRVRSWVKASIDRMAGVKPRAEPLGSLEKRR